MFELCQFWTQWWCKRHLVWGPYLKYEEGDNTWWGHGECGPWGLGNGLGTGIVGVVGHCPDAPSGGDRHCPAAGRVGCWWISAESLSELCVSPKVLSPPWGQPTSHDWSISDILKGHLSPKASGGICWGLGSGCIMVQLLPSPNPIPLTPFTGVRAPQWACTHVAASHTICSQDAWLRTMSGFLGRGCLWETVETFSWLGCCI